METFTHISLEAQMADSIELSPADKAEYCKDAYLAVRKARNYIRDVEQILDLTVNLEHNRIYGKMVQLRHDMFRIIEDLKDLQNEFSKMEDSSEKEEG